MNSVKRLDFIPDGSIISDGFGEFDYCDSYETSIRWQNKSIDQIMTDFLDLSSHSWIVGLKRLRDLTVKRVGLKADNENALINKECYYSVGSQAMIFTVIKRTADEIVMGKDDKHLVFRFSVLLDQNTSKVYITTIVKFYNLGGRIYFWPVKPFHRLIIYSLVKKNLSR